MIKIKIHAIEKHRTETTFRPYLYRHVRNLFREVGIEFVTQGNDYDLIWAAQPTFVDKYQPYNVSVERGINSVNRLKGDVILFDGSDSPSLMGSWDVFKETNALRLMKNSLYANKNWYSERSVLGRYYWGKSEDTDHNYQIDGEIDFTKVLLTGCNWLSTVQPQWFDYSQIPKDFDICAMFSCPAKINAEWKIIHSEYYDRFRKPFLDILEPLKERFTVRTLTNGVHVSAQEYYQIMQRSKIVLAPFGYGEIAPRDIEVAQFGGILLKPDMSHIETLPNPYNSTTFVSCAWDGSDMPKIIESIVGDFKAYQMYYVENMRKEYVQRFNPENFVIHTYNWISNLEGYGSN